METAMVRRLKKPEGSGGSVGAVLGTVAGGIVGSLVPGVGTMAGAALGGTVGGAAGQIVKPGQPGGAGPQPTVMQRRADSASSATLNQSSKVLEDSLMALKEAPDEYRQQYEEPLTKAYVMALNNEYTKSRG